MITKELIKKDFNINKKSMSSNDFLKTFILPLEKWIKKVKINLSEKHDEYLLNIKQWNI